MHASSIRVTQKEDREGGMHQQDIFHGVVFFLAALTCGLFSRVLGAGDAPLCPVLGKRGDAGVAAGAMTSDPGVSTSGATRVAASVSETPSRCARAARERVGASPRVRRVASRAGKRTWLHSLALLCRMPNRRP